MMPNAMEVGPDGMLYYPLLGTNEIWRIDPDGGEPERVAGDLGVPGRGEVRQGRFHRLHPGRHRRRAADRPAQRRPHHAGHDRSRPGQPDLRRGPAVRLRLHRDDHRDPRRRRDQGDPAGRDDLAAGPDRGRRRHALHLRRHLLLRSADRRRARSPRDAVQPRLAGLHPRCRPRWPTANSSSPPRTARSRAGCPRRWNPRCSPEGFDQLYGVAVAPSGDVVAAEQATGRVVSVRGGQVSEPGHRSEPADRRRLHRRRHLPGLRVRRRPGRLGQQLRRRHGAWTAWRSRRASWSAAARSTSSTRAPRC